MSLICFSICGAQLLAGEDGIRNYGSEMPNLGHAISIDQAIIDYQSDTPSVERKFSGYIAEVCQKKGCWIVLAKGRSYARVTFKDYGFFLPSNSLKAKAIVYGRLNLEKLSPKLANHYEKDAGRPAAIKSDQFEYRIVASSVVLDE